VLKRYRGRIHGIKFGSVERSGAGSDSTGVVGQSLCLFSYRSAHVFLCIRGER